MKYTKLSLIVALLFSFSWSYASMLCPGDKNLYCDEDIHDLSKTGKPQLFGSHKYLTPHYEDEYFTNACNVGHIIRKWYLDLNNNGYADYTEPTCYQDIYLQERTYGGIYITYPKDITVACLEDIPFESPKIIGKPCDLLGYTYEDKVYNLLGSGEDGCKKILRKFTIINWCDYDPNGNNTGSIWTGTQVIKVIDKEKPRFLTCDNVTIGFNNGCKATVILKSKALDEGSCSSAKLFWIAEIDLYGDGDVDYVYSHSVTGEFNIPLKNNGEEVQIKLPGTYGRGTHKVIWRVKDSCGNFTSCSTTFTTKDNKPPTPYCIQNVSVTIDGQDPWPLKVPAAMFNLGAFDNCTPSQYIRHSFSPDPADSIRMFNCQNAGFHTLQVYSHDLEGNSTYCDLYIVVYDNGSCQSTLSAAGKVASPKGKALLEGKIEMISENGEKTYYRNIVDGDYLFDNVELNRDLTIVPNRKGLDEGQIDMVDYIIFRNYLMSLDTLTPLGYLAADINDDKRANAKDMVMMKDLLLYDKNSFGDNDWRFIPSYLKPENVTMKNYSPVYDSKKFSGTLDFTCIAKGDFSETLPGEIEPRAAESVLWRTGEATEMDGESWIPVLPTETVDVDGFKFSINKNNSDIRRSENLSIDMAGIAEDKTNLLMAGTATLTNQEPVFFVRATNAFDLQLNGYLVAQGSLSKTTIELMGHGQTSFVFPNPVSEWLTIMAEKDANYSIMDMNGKFHLSGKVNAFKQTINLSSLPTGVYIISLNKGEKVNRFIKL